MKNIKSILFLILIIGLITISCGKLFKKHNITSTTKDDERWFAWVCATTDSTDPLCNGQILWVDTMLCNDSAVWTCPDDKEYYHRDSCSYIIDCSHWLYSELPSEAIKLGYKSCPYCNPPDRDYFHQEFENWYMRCYYLESEGSWIHAVWPSGRIVSHDQLNIYMQQFDLQKCQ